MTQELRVHSVSFGLRRVFIDYKQGGMLHVENLSKWERNHVTTQSYYKNLKRDHFGHAPFVGHTRLIFHEYNVT